MPTKKMDAKRAAKARRLELEAAKREAHRADRRRSWMIASGAVVVGLALILAVLIPQWLKPTPIANRTLKQLGVSVSKAACSAVQNPKVEAKGDVKSPDSKGKAVTIKYSTVPPTSGKSYTTGAAAGTHYYAVGEGPTPETLVRNLQNGYTILWYTPSLPKNQAAQLTYIADQGALVASSSKFIVTPWDTKLGAFPAGKNVALASWGAVQYCGGVSGKTIATYLTAHPSSKAPTPSGSDVPRALITGITGQDGLYLGELLAAKGYEVFGLVRGQNNPKLSVVEEVIPSIQVVEGDLRDLPSLIGALEVCQPDEVYNLAAMSFVGLSWKQAELTGEITGMGVLRVLEAIRIHTQNDMSKVRFYQASSSEMFGKVREVPQTETTPFHPRSPYGVAKTFGHYMTVNYRESYNAYACSGILFNHESPRRGHEFVTRKVTRAVARIALGLQDSVSLGNLEARRDWGFAGDYVEAMWLMLQQSQPEDYVIATGETHSIRELLEVAFARAGITDWEPCVVQDPRFFRPAEVDLLVGSPEKAKRELGWEPKVDFATLVEMMVDADLAAERRLASPRS